MRRTALVVVFLLSLREARAEWMYFSHSNGIESGLARKNLGVPGSQPEILVSSAQLKALGYGDRAAAPIVVDPVAGKVYWNTPGSGAGATQVLRANLDGSGIELVHADLTSPSGYGLAIYQPAGNVPAVSTWGLLVLGLVVVAAGAILLRSRVPRPRA